MGCDGSYGIEWKLSSIPRHGEGCIQRFCQHLVACRSKVCSVSEQGILMHSLRIQKAIVGLYSADARVICQNFVHGKIVGTHGAIVV